MIVLAGAGSFFLYMLLGLGALVFTAMLDGKLGKEKALLVYAVLLLVLTFVNAPEAPAVGQLRAGDENQVPAKQLDAVGDPFKRPDYDYDVGRNVFREYSDTRPLPPEPLPTPPWIEFAFPLPPTIPGPAPAHRRVLRGELPALSAGDGSTIAAIPEAVFTEYEPQPEDVYDWIVDGGKTYYVYILAIDPGDGRWVEEKDPGFDTLKFQLAGNAPEKANMTVKYAVVGTKEKAAKKLERTAVLAARKEFQSELEASKFEEWGLRRTVDNMYVEALRSSGLNLDLKNASISALRRAAEKMAAVGKTGKESKEGWRRAATLLEKALAEARVAAAPALRADILLSLLEAYRALKDDKAILTALAEYVRTSPRSQEPWLWLGDFSLAEQGLADVSLDYYLAARERNAVNPYAHIGEGNARAFAGDHAEALRAYRKAGGSALASLKRGEALLRLGELDNARSEIDSALASDPAYAPAILVRGAIYYAKGDLETARTSFERVATMDAARDERAMACFNLGLTCVRMGQNDAAIAAFDACEKAMQLGAAPGPFPDETVSPALGRAFVALGQGNMGEVRAQLGVARQEAPLSSYVEFLAGVLGYAEGNTTSSIRALTSALARANDYRELDGWLAKTYLDIAEQQVATGAEPSAYNETFRKAVAFAKRAADNEEDADKRATKMRLRQALIELAAAHVPTKQRFSTALATADYVIKRVPGARDNPAAHAIRGYCHYGLGGDENVKQCMRDFQKVLDDVPEEDQGYWKKWRQYADARLKQVKHWDSLEEKTIRFEGTRLSSDWDYSEKNGVRILIDEGTLVFKDESSRDGTYLEPTVYMFNANGSAMFKREAFEEVTMMVRAPKQIQGVSSNNVTFGVQVRSGGSGSKARTPGIGIFFDKAKVAVRVGGGQNDGLKDGLPKRTWVGREAEQEWPSNDWVEVRIARLDADKGLMAVFLNGEEVFRDNVSGFKRTRGKASLWIGGWSNQAEEFHIEVKDIRVIRRKG